MANVHDIAEAAKRFRDDETYKSLIQSIKDAQASVFLNPSSTQEARDEAHEIIRALGKLGNEIDARIADSSMQKKKDQHRAND